MPYCSRCDRSFKQNGYEQHLHASQRHNVCEEHGLDFETRVGLKEHYVQSRDHFYCQRCDEHFDSNRELEEHYEEEHHFCKSHRRIFETEQGLKQHFVQHPDHYYCQYCDEHFSDEDDLMDHAESYHFACRSCVKIFPTQARLDNHLEDCHHYCAPCSRLFRSQANLDHHLASTIHKPRVLACPGRKCGRAFVSVSALVQHAESGACPSGTTRAAVDAYVVRMDRTNAITNPNRLITSGWNWTKYYATMLAWNGRAFECYLCHKQFRTLRALDAHLASPAHAAKIYRCPNGAPACGEEFRTLSGLCQHVEGGYCGVKRFRQVKDIMDSLKSGIRSIAL